MTKIIILLFISILFLAACESGEPVERTQTPQESSSPTPDALTTPTQTPLTPDTVEPGTPLAAIVNGQAITLSEYQAELTRAQGANGTGLLSYTEEDVLQNLIDEVLLAQGAVENGFILDKQNYQTKFDKLVENELDFDAWLKTNGYTRETFEVIYSRTLAATWMRNQIISSVSNTADQVHARQILLFSANDAELAYSQLQNGTDFATLATQYDPITSGELGWFPRGYLTVPSLDEQIFSLQPGEYTEVTETILGFHIIQLIERDPRHPLSPNALRAQQIRAVENWLAERRNQSDIQILLS